MELVGKTLVTSGPKPGGKWSREECASRSLHRTLDFAIFSDAFFMPIEPTWTYGVRRRIDKTARLALTEMEWSEWI